MFDSRISTFCLLVLVGVLAMASLVVFGVEDGWGMRSSFGVSRGGQQQGGQSYRGGTQQYLQQAQQSQRVLQSDRVSQRDNYLLVEVLEWQGVSRWARRGWAGFSRVEQARLIKWRERLAGSLPVGWNVDGLLGPPLPAMSSQSAQTIGYGVVGYQQPGYTPTHQTGSSGGMPSGFSGGGLGSQYVRLGGQASGGGLASKPAVQSMGVDSRSGASQHGQHASGESWFGGQQSSGVPGMFSQTVSRPGSVNDSQPAAQSSFDGSWMGVGQQWDPQQQSNMVTRQQDDPRQHFVPLPQQFAHTGFQQMTGLEGSLQTGSQPGFDSQYPQGSRNSGYPRPQLQHQQSQSYGGQPYNYQSSQVTTITQRGMNFSGQQGAQFNPSQQPQEWTGGYQQNFVMSGGGLQNSSSFQHQQDSMLGYMNPQTAPARLSQPVFDGRYQQSPQDQRIQRNDVYPQLPYQPAIMSQTGLYPEGVRAGYQHDHTSPVGQTHAYPYNSPFTQPVVREKKQKKEKKAKNKTPKKQVSKNTGVMIGGFQNSKIGGNVTQNIRYNNRERQGQ